MFKNGMFIVERLLITPRAAAETVFRKMRRCGKIRGRLSKALRGERELSISALACPEILDNTNVAKTPIYGGKICLRP